MLLDGTMFVLHGVNTDWKMEWLLGAIYQKLITDVMNLRGTDERKREIFERMAQYFLDKAETEMFCRGGYLKADDSEVEYGETTGGE